MDFFFFLLIGLCSLYSVQLQNEICYTYDAAGNRIQQALCCTACLTHSGAEDRQQAAVTGDAEKLIIIPNPTAGVFTLRTEGIPADAQVMLFNMAGDVLAQQLLGEGKFDITAFPPGTYVLHLKTGSLFYVEGKACRIECGPDANIFKTKTGCFYPSQVGVNAHPDPAVPSNEVDCFN